MADLEREHEQFARERGFELKRALANGEEFTARAAAESLLPHGEGHQGLAMVAYGTGRTEQALEHFATARLKFIDESREEEARKVDFFRMLILQELGRIEEADTLEATLIQAYSALPEFQVSEFDFDAAGYLRGQSEWQLAKLDVVRNAF